MFNTVQIVLLSLIGVFAVLAVAFMIAFIVELVLGSRHSSEVEQTEEVTSAFEEDTKKEETTSVNEMLADLDKLTEGEVVEEETKEEVKEEVTEETTEEAKEEATEEPKAEAEEAAEAAEEPKAEASESGDQTNIIIIEDSHEPIVPGSLIDYETRLAKVIENRDKIEKELAKTQKSILKYERTIRRKDRNQKMLDRRAGELTNLNLLMYSVTDIKNVDEDKKVKQEELTAHIAELKASIQDAEEYIESNKSKYNHDLTVVKYLEQEKKRYDDEVAELEALIKAINDSTDTTEAK